MTVPPVIRRWLGPICGGLLAAWYTHAYMNWNPQAIKDFDQNWVAARALLTFQNPYALIGPGRLFPSAFPLAYPITTAVAVLPLGLLPLGVARLVFAGISVTLLLWAVGPRGWRIVVPMLLSRPFMNALWNVQWSLLLTAAMARPDVLSWLAPVKPSIGLGVLGACTTRRQVATALAVGLLLLLVSLALRPTWVPEWIASVRQSPAFPPPMTRLGGPLLLLAGLRWRDPDARMLLGLSIMPQTPGWYEALPLFLIPRTWVGSAVLMVGSHLAFQQGVPTWLAPSWSVEERAIAVQLSLYLPALVMVLSRGVEWPAWRRRLKSPPAAG